MRLFPFFSVPLPIDLYAEMNTSFNIKEEQTWRNLVMRAVLIVASVGLIVWAMPHDNRSYYHIEKGKPWKYADFTAPFDFPIYKSDEAIKAEKDSLMHDYEPYYQYNANKENEMVKRFEKDYAEGIPGLGPEYIEMISNRLHSLYQQGIMSSAEYSELRTDTARMIRVVNGKQANSVSIMEVYSAKSAYEQLFHDEALALQRPILQKCNLNDYITPNLIYDKERSEASINDLMSSIALASGVVQKGQKIVGRGEIVTDRIYRAMDSFIKENERLHQDDTQNQFALLGQILYVAIIIICFTIYLSLYRRDYLVKSRKIMMAYALLRNGAHLHPCVHGLPYGIHGSRHHGYDMCRHAGSPLRVCGYRVHWRTHRHQFAARTVTALPVVQDGHLYCPLHDGCQSGLRLDAHRFAVEN